MSLWYWTWLRKVLSFFLKSRKQVGCVCLNNFRNHSNCNKILYFSMHTNYELLWELLYCKIYNILLKVLGSYTLLGRHCATDLYFQPSFLLLFCLEEEKVEELEFMICLFVRLLTFKVYVFKTETSDVQLGIELRLWKDLKLRPPGF